jgi:hypothetical protein
MLANTCSVSVFQSAGPIVHEQDDGIDPPATAPRIGLV